MKSTLWLILFIANQTLLQAQPYRFQWAKALHGNGPSSLADLTTDQHSSIYLFGDFGDTMDADPGPGQTIFTTTNARDFFAGKYDSTGTLLWARHFNGSNWMDEAREISVDSAGNVYLAGSFSVIFDADPGPGTHYLSSPSLYGHTALLIKLDTQGNFVWARQMGGPGTDRIESISTDAAGNTYFTGTFQDSIDIDPGPATRMLYAGGSSNSAFLGKFNTMGDLVWAHGLGNNTSTEGKGVRLSPGGLPYFFGNMGGTVDFDPGPGTFNLSNTNGYCPYIVRYDTSGQNPFGWNFPYAAPGGFCEMKDLHLDAQGDLLMAGRFYGTIDLDPGPATALFTVLGGEDIFVSKMDTSGQLQWARRMGSNNDEVAESVSSDSYGNVYSTGVFSGITDFDPGNSAFYLYPTPGASSDMFISGLNSSGQLLSAKQIAGATGQVLRFDASGALLLAGTFSGMVDFSPGPSIFTMSSQGYSDVYFQRMIPCQADTFSQTQTACVSYVFGGQILTQSGTYIDTFLSQYDCDSVIHLNLTITSVDTSVVQTGAQLNAQATSGGFQWLECPGMTAINGATSAQFTAGTNGGYAVVVTQNGCSDTSSCYPVSGLGLNDSDNPPISVFPNPVSGQVTIQTSQQDPLVSYSIRDLTGRVIEQAELISTRHTLQTNNWPAGTYLLDLRTTKGSRMIRLRR